MDNGKNVKKQDIKTLHKLLIVVTVKYHKRI